MVAVIILHIIGASFDWDGIWLKMTASCRKGKSSQTLTSTNGLVSEDMDTIPIPSKVMEANEKGTTEDAEAVAARMKFREACLEYEAAIERKYQR
jgi:hypothetical protein